MMKKFINPVLDDYAYTDKKLYAGIESGTEIIITTPSYYAISIDDAIKYLKSKYKSDEHRYIYRDLLKAMK